MSDRPKNVVEGLIPETKMKSGPRDEEWMGYRRRSCEKNFVLTYVIKRRILESHREGSNVLSFI